jgi:hypothetical protein
MTKSSQTLREKVAASPRAKVKPADPKAGTKVVVGGRPAKKDQPKK